MVKIKVIISALDKKFMYVLVTGKQFFEYTPPCKECLINNMCISDHRIVDDVSSVRDYILVKYCNQLKKFIDNNECFFYCIKEGSYGKN